MKVLLFMLASCAVDATTPSAQHPASPLAPIGRLAGAPATLRPGVATYTDVPALRTEPAPMHHHGS
jgi:hypothetical protein